MQIFDKKQIKTLFQPAKDSNGEDNGQVAIIGGSSLFHGAPILSLKTASRVVDMVFFTSPEKQVEKVADYIKSELSSFIWTPFEEVERYIEKADAVLIGPGFMRYKSENAPHHSGQHVCDEACQLTRNTSEELLKKFPSKKWVIDAGSLQTIDPEWIPQNAILTPNKKEFAQLFGTASLAEEMEDNVFVVSKYAKQHNCVIVVKGEKTLVSNGDQSVLVEGGNPGLTKGGTGDVQAGLTAALLAKNEPFLAACAAAQIIKCAADDLFAEQNVYFNADDVAAQIPQTLSALLH